MQVMFNRNLLVLCMSMVLCYTANAQNAARIYIEPNGWSIGTNAGLSDLWGDVGTQSAIDHYTNSKYIKRVAFMGGMFGRYTIHPAMGIRIGLNYGSLYASDDWNYDLALVAPNQGADAYQRYARGQNARDFIFEGSFLLELTPLRFNPESKVAHRRGQPFIGFGFAYFHYTPYSRVGLGSWVKTYDLKLEGQGFGAGFPPAYSLWQPAVPLVIGYRWDMGQHLNLGIEFMYRMTFTDYLDGVSGKYISYTDFKNHFTSQQALIAYEVADKGYLKGFEQPNAAGNMRGNPGNNDSYSTITLTFFYKVVTNTHEWWH